MLKIKTLCELEKKDIDKNIGDLIRFVNDPKYICRKCARVAIKENILCKPIKIKKICPVKYQKNKKNS
jgi:hypothetical protein